MLFGVISHSCDQFLVLYLRHRGDVILIYISKLERSHFICRYLELALFWMYLLT